MAYKPRGMSIERFATGSRIRPAELRTSWHSAPCVRVPFYSRARFETALNNLRNSGLVVIVVPAVASYKLGMVRVHRVHMGNDERYVSGFVGLEGEL